MNYVNEFTQDPQQKINYVQILIKRKIMEPFVKLSSLYIFLTKLQDKLSRENVECYNLQKTGKEGNDQYISRVNKCLDSWQSHFERVGEQSNKHLSNLRQKEAVHFSRLFKCSSESNEQSVQICRKDENERFANELKDTFSQL